MRADSLGGRIVGAIARDPGAESPDISASAELRIWTDAELTVRPGRLGPPRGSMLGRIVAALARTQTATATAPFTLAPPEVPTEDAELTIVLAGRRLARQGSAGRPGRLTRVSGPTRSYEPVEPTSAALLGITTVPA